MFWPGPNIFWSWFRCQNGPETHPKRQKTTSALFWILGGFIIYMKASACQLASVSWNSPRLLFTVIKYFIYSCRYLLCVSDFGRVVPRLDWWKIWLRTNTLSVFLFSDKCNHQSHLQLLLLFAFLKKSLIIVVSKLTNYRGHFLCLSEML